MGRWIAERKVLVTGGYSGIGRAMAAELARRGAEVTIAGRDLPRLDAVAAELEDETGFRIGRLALDLASPASVRAAAERYLETHGVVDVLLLNAGVFLSRYTTNDLGWELVMATNHLGHFLLAGLLLPHVRADGRIVVTASNAHEFPKSLDVDRLTTWEGRYRQMAVYARSKLANVMFAAEFARRYPQGPTAYSFHPGYVWTRMAQDGDAPLAGLIWRLQRFRLRSPEEGAATGVHLATEPDLEPLTGRYFFDSRPVPWNPLVDDEALRRRLWERSEELVELSYPTR
ncbi:MAG TPA: SDR family NAD(P)-dependent oxidoreductase [Actinobacteria bacterium]|nr:SDR family NAD(P)-dependent oxidoreductase [Actinomycetota bacterium]